MKLAVSYLKTKKNVKSFIKSIDNIKEIEFLHCDYIDNKFSSQKNLSLSDHQKLWSLTSKPLDIHLMCVNNRKIILELGSYNVSCITIHSDDALKENINLIKAMGIKAGIALNPSDSIDNVVNHLDIIDCVLVMGVEPGMAGQPIINSVINNLENVFLLKEKKPSLIISFDGGINNETIDLVRDKCDIIVVGSYIGMADNYEKALKELNI